MANTSEAPGRGQNGRLSVSGDPDKGAPAKGPAQTRRDYQRDRAITLYLSGHSQEKAYNLAFKPRGDPDKRNSMAYAWFARLSVAERTEQLRDAAHISDLDNTGRYLCDLLDAINETREDGHWTAYSNLMKQRQQVLGLATNNVNVSVEHKLTDVELVAKIAGPDVDLAVRLRAQLGTDNSFE